MIVPIVCFNMNRKRTYMYMWVHPMLCVWLQPPSDVVPQATITDCGAQMIVRGNISSRAFVHGKATVAEATQVSGCLCSWSISWYMRHGKATVAEATQVSGCLCSWSISWYMRHGKATVAEATQVSGCLCSWSISWYMRHGKATVAEATQVSGVACVAGVYRDTWDMAKLL